MKNLFLCSLALASVVMTGCASMAVTDDAIEKNTAFALGLEKGDFTVSNRQDSGLKSTYSVATKAGKKYNCYVEGTVSVVGRVVSDAICVELGKAGTPAKGTDPSCNALLKAAGKCK